MTLSLLKECKSKNGGLSDFDERYVFHRIGWNFRMSDAPAAFGIEQLKKIKTNY